ncbi:MAG: WYL domain-containing protein [Bacillota bacterium]|nr:WYL domain-containing protein [Bacillota bacterium]
MRIITVKLLADESLRYWMVEFYGEENLESAGNNKLIVRFPFVEDEFGYRILLGFGDKCECLEPSNVREELIRRIKKSLEIYTPIL